jgi:hypothetical protein
VAVFISYLPPISFFRLNTANLQFNTIIYLNTNTTREGTVLGLTAVTAHFFSGPDVPQLRCGGARGPEIYRRQNWGESFCDLLNKINLQSNTILYLNTNTTREGTVTDLAAVNAHFFSGPGIPQLRSSACGPEIYQQQNWEGVLLRPS